MSSPSFGPPPGGPSPIDPTAVDAGPSRQERRHDRRATKALGRVATLDVELSEIRDAIHFYDALADVAGRVVDEDFGGLNSFPDPAERERQLLTPTGDKGLDAANKRKAILARQTKGQEAQARISHAMAGGGPLPSGDLTKPPKPGVVVDTLVTSLGTPVPRPKGTKQRRAAMRTESMIRGIRDERKELTDSTKIFSGTYERRNKMSRLARVTDGIRTSRQYKAGRIDASEVLDRRTARKRGEVDLHRDVHTIRGKEASLDHLTDGGIIRNRKGVVGKLRKGADKEAKKREKLVKKREKLVQKADSHIRKRDEASARRTTI